MFGRSKPKSTEQPLANRAESVVSEIVRHVEHPELRPARHFGWWHRYMLPLMLLGFAGLVLWWQYESSPHVRRAGADVSSLSASEKAQAALQLIFEGDKLCKEAKSKWWDDDETMFEDAKSKYLEAWSLLYRETKYPAEGAMTHDSPECRAAARGLKAKIQLCVDEICWMPWAKE